MRSSHFQPFELPEKVASFSQKVRAAAFEFVKPTIKRTIAGAAAGGILGGPVGAAIGGTLAGGAPAIKFGAKLGFVSAGIAKKAGAYGLEKIYGFAEKSHIKNTAEMLGASGEEIEKMFKEGQTPVVKRGLSSTTIAHKDSVNVMVDGEKFKIGNEYAGTMGEITKGQELVSGSHLKSLGGFAKNTVSHLKGTALMSGGLYALMGYATYDKDAALHDKALHIGKYAAAGAADIATFGLTETVGTALSMAGPLGAMAGGALTLGAMGLTFAGADPASLVLKFGDLAEERYNRIKNGPQFNMTHGSAQALQRHLSTLQSSGSNMAEAMHN